MVPLVAHNESTNISQEKGITGPEDSLNFPRAEVYIYGQRPTRTNCASDLGSIHTEDIMKAQVLGPIKGQGSWWRDVSLDQYFSRETVGRGDSGWSNLLMFYRSCTSRNWGQVYWFWQGHCWVITSNISPLLNLDDVFPSHMATDIRLGKLLSNRTFALHTEALGSVIRQHTAKLMCQVWSLRSESARDLHFVSFMIFHFSCSSASERWPAYR